MKYFETVFKVIEVQNPWLLVATCRIGVVARTNVVEVVLTTRQARRPFSRSFFSVVHKKSQCL